MLLVLEDEHKKHLNILNTVKNEVVLEFCRIAVEFIYKGPNPKVFQAAANKLGVEIETVQHGIEGIVYLFSEAAKLLINEIDFQDSIMTLGFDEDLSKDLLQIYLENRIAIREVLLKMNPDLPHYQNLEWRFDVQLASRSLHHQITPQLLLKFHTEDSGKREVQVLQTDPVNLIHLTHTLEQALEQAKTAHCRRIIRNINK